MRSINRKIGLVVLGSMLLVPLLFVNKTSAAAVPNTVKYKAAYEGVYQCFVGGAYNSSFLASSGGFGMIKDPLAGDTVKLPYGLTNAADNNANCKEILKGFKDDTNSSIDNLRAGLFQRGIYSNSTDNSESYTSLNSINKITVKDYFAGANNKGEDGSMGYVAEEVEEDGAIKDGASMSRARITFTSNREAIANSCYKTVGDQPVAGDAYLFDDQGNRISELVFPAIAKKVEDPKPWYDPSGWFGHERWEVDPTGINVPEPGSNASVTYHFCSDINYIVIKNTGGRENPHYNISTHVVTYPSGAATPLVSGGTAVLEASGDGWSVTDYLEGLFDISVATEEVKETGVFNDYNLTFGGNKMRAIMKLSATSAAGYSLAIDKNVGYGALALSDAEIYALYTYYIKDVFGYPTVCEGDAEFSNYNDSNSKEIKWAKGKKCRLYTQIAKTPPAYKVYGINNNTKHFVREVSLDDVINGLNMLPDSVFDELDDAETGGTLGVEPSTDGDDSGVDNRCFAAAASLGWIVCPVIQAVGNAVEGIYKNVVAPFLTIDAQYFSTTGGRSGIYDGWNAFREFANIVFVILFVIVILAQVTGIGISNYNVKKILPRLIVIVVLVNISFIICQLAVDLSNILGYQLNHLFADQLASSITIDPVVIEDKSYDVSYTLGGMVSAITMVLAGGAGYLAVVNWQLWIIPLLLALLSCGIGILFFFVILGVRQAGVIILAVLAPVAIVCYALPNTKSIFDKWRKLFTSLLILYPLCGILMGGGVFASKLLIAVNGGENFFYTLVAMLLTVVPFFFIPTLLKSSMAALGNIGTKLSNMGKSWGGAATRGISSTDTVNDWKRQLEKRHNLSVANRLDRRLARRRDSNPNATLSAGAMRRLARAKVAYQGSMLDEGSNQFISESMTPESIQQALGAQQFEQEQKLINNAAQSMVQGNVRYTDSAGVEQTIDSADSVSGGSLHRALKHYMNQYDATGDSRMLTQARAVAQNMINRGGDKGRSVVMEEIRKRTFDPATGVHQQRTASLDGIASYINRDSQWMSKLKNEDQGAFRLVSDLARAYDPNDRTTDPVLNNHYQYSFTGLDKITENMVSGLSDDFYDSLDDEFQRVNRTGFKNSIFDNDPTNTNFNQKALDDLQELDRTFQSALSDSRTSQNIKPGDLKNINKVHHAAYHYGLNNYLRANPGKTITDYEGLHGVYKPLKKI